jgi:hypothetical protein
MVHLLALPGAPSYEGDPALIERAMLRDAEALADGGVAALCLENLGDAPFYPGTVPTAVVTHMTSLATRLRDRFNTMPLGINVLRNDGCAALAIAHAVGAQFVRVNVLCGARVTDQGIIEGIAHRLMRQRKLLGAERIRVFGDVNVKHSTTLGNMALDDEVSDTIHRGLTDAVIVTGSGTGRPVDLGELKVVRNAAGSTPVLVGSGVTADSIKSMAAVADGLIVGSSVKRNGIVNEPVDVQRVRDLMARL